MENPNPGKRRGQIHIHDGGGKYLYDVAAEVFVGAPNTINDLLRQVDVREAIAKALRFLGEVV